VFLAKGATALCVETLSFQVHSADSTVEALGVPVLPQSLYPAIGRFDGEFAAVAFGGEKFVPMRRAIRIAVLDVEARRSDGLLAVEATEALRMPRLSHGIDAVVFDRKVALCAFGCEIGFVAVFAEELTLFLDEAAILERTSAGTNAAFRIRAFESVRSKRLAQGQDKRASDLLSRHGADGDFAGEDGLLDFGASGASERRLPRPFGDRRHLRGCGGGRRGCGRGGGRGGGCGGGSG